MVNKSVVDVKIWHNNGIQWVFYSNYWTAVNALGVPAGVNCLCLPFIGLRVLRNPYQIQCAEVAWTMSVAPARKKNQSTEIMENTSKINHYLQYGIGMLVILVGLFPFKINKKTWALSFQWISSETIWSLVRLVVFNFPFSLLPFILWGFYGPGEAKTENWGFSNNTNGSMSMKPQVFVIVFAVEYVSSYTFFILFRAAKKENSSLVATEKYTLNFGHCPN